MADKIAHTAEGVPEDAMRRLAELKPGAPGSIFTFPGFSTCNSFGGLDLRAIGSMPFPKT